MKKKPILITIALAMLGSFAIVTYNYLKPCVANGKVVCFDEKTQLYTIEEDAKLIVYVKNNQQRSYLLNNIDKLIEDASYQLKVEVQPTLKAWDAMFEHDVDIFYTQQEEAAMIVEELMEIQMDYAAVRSQVGIEHLSQTINSVKNVFMPISYEGLLFTYNQTLLEELGFDVNQVDDKNRVVELNNWEAIIDLTNAWHTESPHDHLNSIFPFNIAESWQFYPFLTAGGWQMFSERDITSAGFESEAFLESLRFLKEVFETSWYFKDAQQHIWNYENALINDETLFSLTSTWMNWEEIASIKQQEYSYSAFPDYEEHTLTPLVKVEGLVVKDNPYPSLSHAVISLLNSLDNVQVLLDSSDEDLVIAHDEFEHLKMSDKRQEKALAYSYSVVEPLLALDANPKILGWDFYLQGHVFEIVHEIYEQNLSIEAGQAALVEAYQLWYNQNNQ